MFVQRPHFYHVVGTMYVRDSGLGKPLLECTVLRTRATRDPRGVRFVEPTSGSDYYRVTDWFSDWVDERDNYSVRDGHDVGRLVEVAVDSMELEAVLAGNARSIVRMVAVHIDEPGIGWRALAPDRAADESVPIRWGI
jgi:hypothetical protein